MWFYNDLVTETGEFDLALRWNGMMSENAEALFKLEWASENAEALFKLVWASENAEALLKLEWASGRVSLDGAGLRTTLDLAEWKSI